MNDEREVEDVVSEEFPVAKSKARHVHIFRKEYPKCLIRGCDARKSRQPF